LVNQNISETEAALTSINNSVTLEKYLKYKNSKIYYCYISTKK